LLLKEANGEFDGADRGADEEHVRARHEKKPRQNEKISKYVADLLFHMVV
jgi:hypothetical protein